MDWDHQWSEKEILKQVRNFSEDYEKKDGDIKVKGASLLESVSKHFRDMHQSIKWPLCLKPIRNTAYTREKKYAPHQYVDNYLKLVNPAAFKNEEFIEWKNPSIDYY